MRADEKTRDTDAARRCLTVAAGLPGAWRKLLIAVACGETPEDVIGPNGKPYGDHGRLLFTQILDRHDR